MKKRYVDGEIITHPAENFFSNKNYRKEFRRLFFNYEEILKLVKDVLFWIGVPFALTIFADYPIDKYKSALVVLAFAIALIIRVVFIDRVIRKVNIATATTNCDIYVHEPNHFEIIFKQKMRCIPSVACNSSAKYEIRNLTIKGFEIYYVGKDRTLLVGDLAFRATALP